MVFTEADLPHINQTAYRKADDIRTLATSEASLEAQVALVNEFASTNFLKLNLSKCEIVVFSRDRRVTLPTCEVDGFVLPVGDVGQCLGLLVGRGSPSNTCGGGKYQKGLEGLLSLPRARMREAGLSNRFCLSVCPASVSRVKLKSRNVQLLNQTKRWEYEKKKRLCT